MSASRWLGKIWLASSAIVLTLGIVGLAVAEKPLPRESALSAQNDRGPEEVSGPTTWRVSRPISGTQRMPLARLIRNPDASGGSPPYALADQSGKIQRYVEPVPGIDLESYVGFAVMVKHDTGRTLLASQLELPGPNSDPVAPANEMTIATNATPASRVESLFTGLVNEPVQTAGASPRFQPPALPQMAQAGTVQQAQFTQAPMQSAAPVVIQEGAPMEGGMMPYEAMDPAMQGMPPGMTMQGAPMQGMQGMPMNAYPPGAGPVYLDGPGACGPGCQSCQVPCQSCPQPCQPMVPCQPILIQPPPPPQERWSVWGEALWLHPTGVDMAHAQQQNGIGGAGTVPFGRIGVLDPDFDLGFRAGVEVKFSPKESAFVSYTFFESDAEDHLSAPDIVGGGGAVGSLVHHPGASITASTGPVDATYDIDFQLGDAACRYFVACTRTSELTVFLGARYGQLKQGFGQTGVFSGGQGGQIDTTTQIDFQGGGPIVGMTGEHTIGCTRFSTYGRALAGALTGEFRSHYTMFNQSTTSLLAQSDWTDDRIVPMLDYELGVAWTGPNGRLRLSAGYLVSTWFNVVTTPTFVDAVQANNYVDVSDSLSFDGLVGRVECRW